MVYWVKAKRARLGLLVWISARRVIPPEYRPEGGRNSGAATVGVGGGQGLGHGGGHFRDLGDLAF
jgi:hypothetical protein